MKKLATDFGVSVLLLSFVLFLGRFAVTISALSAVRNAVQNVDGTPMHKVQLTQKGYIQFLRWELPVPEIHEFTFCLWVKSNDLKHPHSILSYSKNERERLIRSWISSRGRSIHLEINGAEVFRRPVGIREQRWYHVCQSWENRVGRYALWLDGHLELQGHSEEMIDHVIPEGGDIVLGQEYTDFDKGLEEGIEGAVLGFNLLLASAFDSPDSGYQRPAFQTAVAATDPVAEHPFGARFRTKITTYDSNRVRDAHVSPDKSSVSERYALGPNWSRRIFPGAKTTENSAISTPSYLLNVANDTWGEKTPSIRKNDIIFDYPIEKISVSGESSSEDPLGLQLVRLSYVRCQLGMGSPHIGGPLMLISWSRTPVRVFGGAIIKNVGNECGNF